MGNMLRTRDHCDGKHQQVKSNL